LTAGDNRKTLAVHLRITGGIAHQPAANADIILRLRRKNRQNGQQKSKTNNAHEVSPLSDSVFRFCAFAGKNASAKINAKINAKNRRGTEKTGNFVSRAGRAISGA
jgi:hypothetical protein